MNLYQYNGEEILADYLKKDFQIIRHRPELPEKGKEALIMMILGRLLCPLRAYLGWIEHKAIFDFYFATRLVRKWQKSCQTREELLDYQPDLLAVFPETIYLASVDMKRVANLCSYRSQFSLRTV